MGDVVVGAPGLDGGIGGVVVMQMKATGSVSSSQVLSRTQGNLNAWIWHGFGAR